MEIITHRFNSQAEATLTHCFNSGSYGIYYALL